MTTTNGTTSARHAVKKLPLPGVPCACGKAIPDAVRASILDQGKTKACSCGVRYWTRDWSPDAGTPGDPA